MAKGDGYDGLEQAAGGDVRATAELMGATFELIDFEEIQTRWEDERTDAKRQTQIATLILDGEELRYWLGGVKVNRQLAYLKTTGRLPLVMKLGGEGNQDSPYKLVRPDEAPAESPLVKRAKAAGARPVKDAPFDSLQSFRGNDGKLDGAAFVRFWQGQGYGPDNLSDIVGAASGPAVEEWFKKNKGKTVDDLLTIAQANRVSEEALPFD